MTAWAVHLPTAGETTVRLRLRPRGERDPWPFSLAVTELGRLGATGEGRFRSVGSGRGEPIIASQELRWRGCELHLETVRTGDGRREVVLSLPSWDELVAQPEATEADLWELVDALAATLDAEDGSLDGGLALLLPEAAAERFDPGRAARYRELPRSGLSVLLR